MILTRSKKPGFGVITHHSPAVRKSSETQIVYSWTPTFAKATVDKGEPGTDSCICAMRRYKKTGRKRRIWLDYQPLTSNEISGRIVAITRSSPGVRRSSKPQIVDSWTPTFAKAMVGKGEPVPGSRPARVHKKSGVKPDYLCSTPSRIRTGDLCDENAPS